LSADLAEDGSPNHVAAAFIQKALRVPLRMLPVMLVLSDMTRLERAVPSEPPIVYEVWKTAPPTERSSSLTRFAASTLPMHMVLERRQWEV
jgi:hypothetical protein